MPFRIPDSKINWTNSSFLIGTGLATITAVPVYIWKYGLNTFQIGLFLAFFIATGLSITLGYHRLFAHKAFTAKWPVRFLTLIFGAAAFENCALAWVSDHRRHHKHTDHDDDPYDISKGFWHAHIGWILFKVNPEPPWDNVNDLRKDKLVMWQDKYYVTIAVTVGFLIPAALGFLHSGWVGALGGFLLGGVARVTAVQHMTFFINSLCHSIGSRPYSSRTSARDSWLMAIFTFGEGYHNYHHEFQHDYRNGVRWWQWDPTKWTIWTLHKLGLADNLRRVDDHKLLAAQLKETRRRVEEHMELSWDSLNTRSRELLKTSAERLDELGERWAEVKEHYLAQMETLKSDVAHAKDEKIREARRALEEIRREVTRTIEMLDRLPTPAVA